MTTWLRFSVCAAFSIFIAREAHAQSPPDEIDLGDNWVAPDAEGGWFAPWTPALIEDAGSFRLDLSAGAGLDSWAEANEGMGASASARRSLNQDYYAFATLQIPLDGLLSTHRSSRSEKSIEEPLRFAERSDSDEESSLPEARHDEAEVKQSTDPPLVLAGDPLQNEMQEGSANASASAEESSWSRTLMLAVVRELAEKVGAPLQHADRRLKSLVRRSRWSGLSPELRLRGVLGFDRTTSTEDSVGIYPGDTTVRGARDSLAEVRLTFRLDRLVLGDGEDSIERQRIDLEEEHRELVREALELFSVWRLASARSADPSLPPDDRLQALIDAEAALLQLHLMTGGWFSGEESVEQVARSLPDVRNPSP